MNYSIDTSSLIDAWVRHYAPDVFPRWWVLFEESVGDGQVRASLPVLLDLEKKDDAIHAWAKVHPQLFISIDEDIQAEVTSILARYSRLVENRKNKSASDPFVIALARLENACVITGEKPSGTIDKPKIPDVCQALSIPCINLLEFMRRMKWRIE
jgi:hypothetical protein